MLKIIFGIVAAGALYYVITPLLGRKVNWVETEDPIDEKIRELQLKKKINLKALKDIEFELASGKINDEDYKELKDHYLQRVSRIMNRIEALSSENDFSENTTDAEEILETHHGDARESDPEDEEDLEDDEEWTQGDEEEFDDEDDEPYEMDSSGEDWEEEDEEEYRRRGMKGPVLAVLAFVLAMGTGAAIYQMGKRSAVQKAEIPVASLPSENPGQTGLEHLLQYVQENPWNVTSHLVLGEYYLGEGNTDLALSHFISAEQVAPNDGRVLSDLGKAYRNLGDPDQAIEKFRAAADADPESLEYLYQLGLVYGYDKGDPDQAVQLFQEILSRQPDEELRATVNKELQNLGSSDS